MSSDIMLVLLYSQNVQKAKGKRGRGDYFTNNPETFPEESFSNAQTLPKIS